MRPVRLETERLILRDWTDADWAPFFAGTNTPAVMRWLGGVLDADRQAAVRARLEGYAHDYGHTFWCVERKEDAAILGFCGLKRSNQTGGPMGMMEVGWRLREDAWGRGYAREAATASLDFAFDHSDTSDVIAMTVPGNVGSWTLMERLGMARRADLDFDSTDFDDEGRIIIYAITRDAWHAQKPPRP